MDISGLVITTSPGQADAVARRIAACPGIEVVAAQEDRVVLVVETEDTAGQREIFRRLRSSPGVIDIAVAYHHFEDIAGRRMESGVG